MGSLIRICVLILTISYAVNVWAWDDDTTHYDLSEKAVEYSILSPARGNYIKNLGLTKGLDETFESTYPIGTETRRGTYTVSEWVGARGIVEDAGNIFTAYYYNHFHNPLFSFPWDQAGLNSTQPAHVRNDPHPLDEKGVIPGFKYWVKKNRGTVLSMSSSPVFSTVSLTTAAGNYVPITQLWDTDQYNSSNPPAATDVGVSEWTSINFLIEKRLC